MCAGPALPQPVKVKDEGNDYWYGRGVREAPDLDMQVLSLGGQDLPRTDVRRDRIDRRFWDEAEFDPDKDPEAASSSQPASTSTQQWLRPTVPSSQPAPAPQPPPAAPVRQPHVVQPRPQYAQRAQTHAATLAIVPWQQQEGEWWSQDHAWQQPQLGWDQQWGGDDQGWYQWHSGGYWQS